MLASAATCSTSATAASLAALCWAAGQVAPSLQAALAGQVPASLDAQQVEAFAAPQLPLQELALSTAHAASAQQELMLALLAALEQLELAVVRYMVPANAKLATNAPYRNSFNVDIFRPFERGTNAASNSTRSVNEFYAAGEGMVHRPAFASLLYRFRYCCRGCFFAVFSLVM